MKKHFVGVYLDTDMVSRLDEVGDKLAGSRSQAARYLLAKILDLQETP